MAKISFQGQTYQAAAGETVLDLLEREGYAVPSSCRSGVCQSCLLRATKGVPPGAAQSGVKDTLRAQGYFLSCRCEPVEDMDVEMPGEGVAKYGTTITGIEWLSKTVIELRTTRPEGFDYCAGQFATLISPEGVARSYSIASVPELDDDLVFQIALLPNGAMSGWLAEHAKPGTTLDVQGPNGACFYVAGKPDQSLVLAGTGTGLAPLFGIARDALRQGHAAAVHLFHGSLASEGLYLVDALRALAEKHDNFHYYPCALNGPAPAGIHVGALDSHLLERLPSLTGHRAYLCGAPEFVKLMQRKVFLAGVSLPEILADSFLPAKAAPGA
ncbi:MAG: 2Fe-2S iron-sulfur cluster binding domain-containing protein [Candidatus Hydrogenedentes bacterium]|nr:2Fe-2S iron-sulfur cluster binding domain-containing protein [Candidatus Hydrogenedentota bacterium]